jgi:hypothetical protein
MSNETSETVLAASTLIPEAMDDPVVTEQPASTTLDERIVSATVSNYQEVLGEIALFEDLIVQDSYITKLAKTLGINKSLLGKELKKKTEATAVAADGDGAEGTKKAVFPGLVDLVKDDAGQIRYLMKQVDGLHLAESWVDADGYADAIMGSAFQSKDFVSNGLQLLRMGNLYGRKLDLTREPVFLPSQFQKLYQKFLLYPGDIVLSMTGTTGKQDYGYAVMIPDNSPDMLLNQRVVKIDPKIGLDKDYLLQLVWSSAFLSQIYQLSPGSKQANLSKNDLLKMKVPLPSMKIQREIVALLSKCLDSKIALEERSRRSMQLKNHMLKYLLAGY